MATTKNTYTGNNSTTDYSFTFPYLKQTDIKVTLDNVATTAYTFHDATTVRFNSAPATDAAIAIYRSTDDSNLVATFYPGSAIRSSDLNDNYTQNLYSTQENTNDATEALDNSRVLESGDYVSAITKANAAVATANTADTNASAAVSTANTASASATSAVNTANTATSTANGAVTTANAATTTANGAVTTANAATTTANGAVTTANGAVTTANGAVTTANTANTTAGNAVTTANAANTTAGNAVTTANAATATANTASTNASAAVTTANSASASVAAAAIYKVVPDLSTLTTDYPLTGNQPSPPGPDPSNLAPTPDGTYVQITDSTGISLANGTWAGGDFSGSSSFPNGFGGNPQLTLRVKVSNASAGSETYIAQEYYANDPEARYGEDRKVIVESNRTISEDYTIQTTMNAHSVGPVTLSHNSTDLTYNATTYVTSNSATAGYTVTIPENSTWLIS